MILDNPEGFRFGFELEVNWRRVTTYGVDKCLDTVQEMNAGKFTDNDIIWEWCPDGEGSEFRTERPFDDLNQFMIDARKLVGILKQYNAHVTQKLDAFSVRDPHSDGYFSTSPRGIHIHISHPYRTIKRNNSNRQEMDALNVLPITKAHNRQHYCTIRVHTEKYSAIHVVSHNRLEVRAYNATLNLRGIAWAFQNAQKVARILFNPA